MSTKGYKNSRLGLIPENWKEASLGQVDHFLTSGSRGWSRFYCDEGALFVRITNLTRNHIGLDLSKCRFVNVPATNEEGKRTRLIKGDVLISITADLGIVAYYAINETHPQAYVNQHIALLRFLSRDLSSKFVAYQLSAHQAQRKFRQITDQGAKSGLNLSAIRAFPMVLPHICEQEAITEVLECWDKAIRNYERKIEKEQNVKKGLMQRLLSGEQRLPGFEGEWQNQKMEDFGIFGKGKGIAKSDIQDSGLPCIRYGQIYQTTAFSVTRFLSYISRECASNSTRLRWNDLLLTGSGETIDEIGKAIAFMGKMEAYAGGDIVIFSPISSLTRADFLAYYMNSKGRSAIRRLGQGQSVVHIYARNLATVKVPLPPLEEQIAIVGVLAAADAEIVTLEKKLTALKEQKRYLLNNMVIGAIRLPQFVNQGAKA